MRIWERPVFQVGFFFLFLGGIAWWTFQFVSLPPAIRNLFEEDAAIAAAAMPPSEQEQWESELAKLPPPPQNHAPEVLALLARLEGLPPIPYSLTRALERDFTASPEQPPPPWTEEEKAALLAMQEAFLAVWSPFLQGQAPDWIRYPDSTLLFRSTFFLFAQMEGMVDLLAHQPGEGRRLGLVQELLGIPELLIPVLRQCRNLGSIRLARSPWEFSETIRSAKTTAACVETWVSAQDISWETLEGLRASLAPAPTLLDLRAGLASDQSLFLRLADFLDSLPPATPPFLGLFRILRNPEDTREILELSGKPETVAGLATQLRLEAEEMEILRQKTFLAAPAWRQWLLEDPGRGLNPLLARGLGGFREFEEVRMNYLVATAGLDARIALEKEGLPAARRIPDPAQPGSFMTVEETPEGVRISTAHIPAGQSDPVSYLLPGANSGRP